MDQYIDGFILSVPKDKIDAYVALAEKAATIWKDNGALEYRECIGDDTDVQDQVPFPKLAGTQSDEVVIFSYVVFASREARDEANKKIMADPCINEIGSEAKKLFDCKRMAYGGFKSLLHR